MASTITVATRERCTACGGTGERERQAQVRPCQQALCVYVASKSAVTLDQVAQWIVEVGGQPKAWAYGYLVEAAAKGLLTVEDVEGLQVVERPVQLTELGHHVAMNTNR
ncbi:MAG: hypothetical protein ACRD0K_01505 [Egibacteraceae bacterium]